jgi:hypothetical protein
MKDLGQMYYGIGGVTEIIGDLPYSGDTDEVRFDVLQVHGDKSEEVE